MKIKAQHGFMGNLGDKGYQPARKCNIHGWHGVFYICNYYSRYLKNKIKKEATKWTNNPKWMIINE